jgi:uncharacterized delta-60 repeat protein
MRPTLAAILSLGLLTGLDAAALCAADGDPDPTFSADGKATVLWDEDGIALADAVAVAPFDDGSLVVGGTLTWVPTEGGITGDWILVKLTSGGVVDTGWADNGRRRIGFDLVDAGFDRLFGVYPEPDGAVLVVGTTFDGETQIPALARLTSSGDPDPAFGVGGLLHVPTPWSNPTAIWVASGRQRDGKLLLAGYCVLCPANSSHYNPFAVRFHANGALDTSFSFDGWAPISDGGTANDWLTALGATSDGRVLLGFLADGEPRVARLNTIGGLDGTFSGDGFVTIEPGLGEYRVGALLADPATDETYVVLNGTILDGEFAFVDRLTAGGAQDTTWGEDGGAFFSYEEGVGLTGAALQGDGKLVVAGWMNATGAQQGGFFLGRLDGDGQKDASFDGNGVARYEFDRTLNGEDAALGLALSGGRPVAVGSAEDGAGEIDMALLRVENAYLFADGFEAGEALSWSGAAP